MKARSDTLPIAAISFIFGAVCAAGLSIAFFETPAPRVIEVERVSVETLHIGVDEKLACSVAGYNFMTAEEYTEGYYYFADGVALDCSAEKRKEKQ